MAQAKKKEACTKATSPKEKIPWPLTYVLHPHAAMGKCSEPVVILRGNNAAEIVCRP